MCGGAEGGVAMSEDGSIRTDGAMVRSVVEYVCRENVAQEMQVEERGERSGLINSATIPRRAPGFRLR